MQSLPWITDLFAQSMQYQRYACSKCKGSSYCVHDRLKIRCKACGGSGLCSTPLCETRKNHIYKTHCARCFIFLNPDTPVGRNFKTKEVAVRYFILVQFPEQTWICDKRLLDACSLRRPDLTLDMGSHVIFIEVKENGHNSGYTCGNKRLCELWKDAAYRSCVFLRINPDAYVDENGTNVKSC